MGICPRMSRPVKHVRWIPDPNEVDPPIRVASTVLFEVPCLEDKCQFWTAAYTVTGEVRVGCADVVNACKDSNGSVPV